MNEQRAAIAASLSAAAVAALRSLGECVQFNHGNTQPIDVYCDPGAITYESRDIAGAVATVKVRKFHVPTQESFPPRDGIRPLTDWFTYEDVAWRVLEHATDGMQVMWTVTTHEYDLLKLGGGA